MVNFVVMWWVVVVLFCASYLLLLVQNIDKKLELVLVNVSLLIAVKYKETELEHFDLLKAAVCHDLCTCACVSGN